MLSKHAAAHANRHTMHAYISGILCGIPCRHAAGHANMPTCRQTCRQACYSATPCHMLSFTLSMPPGVSFEHVVLYAVEYGDGHADTHDSKHVICPRCWQCRRPCRQAYHPACHCPACAERHAARPRPTKIPYTLATGCLPKCRYVSGLSPLATPVTPGSCVC